MRNKRDGLKSYEEYKSFQKRIIQVYHQVSQHPTKEPFVYLPTNLCMLHDYFI